MGVQIGQLFICVVSLIFVLVLSDLIVRRHGETISVLITGTDESLPVVARAGGTDITLEGIVLGQFQVAGYCRGAVATLGDDVDNTTGAAWAIEY